MIDKKIYKDKNYWHLDGHKTIDMVYDYISNDQNIIKHGFYPFIHYEMKFNKFNIKKNYGERRKPKKRQIYYCSHIDRYIYQRYAEIYNNFYNQYCLSNGFDKCSIAYRNNKEGKCNIHFAKDTFRFLKERDNCFIMIGDFTNFFDNLDHKYLKEKLCRVSMQKKLTESQYKIFKSITKFSYLDIQDIAKFLNIQQKKITTLRPKLSSSDLHKLKKDFLKSNKEAEVWKTYGIPQGSPISAIYANIYMIDFDKALNDLTKKYKGFYRRYSDDFIIIVPNIKFEQFTDVAQEIIEVVNKIPRLILEPKKTSFYSYNENNVSAINNILPEQINESKILNFLGFSFDGKKIKLRDKTTTKYYYKLYNIIDRQMRLEFNREHKNLKNRKSVRHRRTAIIKKKSRFGAKIIEGKGTNFISYVKKCIRLFPKEQAIKLVQERNLDKISKRFNINLNSKKKNKFKTKKNQEQS